MPDWEAKTVTPMVPAARLAPAEPVAMASDAPGTTGSSPVQVAPAVADATPNPYPAPPPLDTITPGHCTSTPARVAKDPSARAGCADVRQKNARTDSRTTVRFIAYPPLELLGPPSIR